MIEREQKTRELAYYLWDMAGRAAKLDAEKADAPFDHIAR
jgi:hypothetical protein